MLEKCGMGFGDFLLGAAVGIVVSCDRLACPVRRAGKWSRMSVVGEARGAKYSAAIEEGQNLLLRAESYPDSTTRSVRHILLSSFC